MNDDVSADEWENLSDYEKDALSRAEERFSKPADEGSPFSILKEIHRARIYDNSLMFYDNREQNPTVAEEYRHVPLLVYSEKNRLFPLCSSLMTNWFGEIEDLLQLLLRAERDESAGEELTLYSMQINDNSYTVGPVGELTMFMNKDAFAQVVSEFLEVVGQMNLSVPYDLQKARSLAVELGNSAKTQAAN